MEEIPLELFVHITKLTAITLLDFMSLALLLSAIFSWIPMDENGFTAFLSRVTEPILFPYRWLFYKLNLFQGVPLDMAFLFTVITVSFLRFALSML